MDDDTLLLYVEESREHLADIENDLLAIESSAADIDDELVEIVMVRYHLKTKREAVDYALRHLVGQPMTREEMLDMCGSLPDFDIPSDPPDFQHDWHDDPR